MEYCICSCGKLLYYDMYTHHSCDKYIYENFFSEKIRELGFRDGYLYGIEIAKIDTIYKEPYDDYIDINHIDIPTEALFYSESYEDSYTIGYERGYRDTFDIHKYIFFELNDMLNLRIFRNTITKKYPLMFDENIIKIIENMLR